MKATIQEITNAIDTKIRPGLIRHGGDLNIVDFQGGVLEIELFGTYRNSPSSYFIIEEIIKNALVGLVEEVHITNSMDEPLLTFAKSIFHKKKP